MKSKRIFLQQKRKSSQQVSKRKTLLKVVGFSMATCASASVFAYCYIADPAAIAATQFAVAANSGEIVGATGTIAGALTALDASLAASLLYQNETTLNAIAMLTKQKAVSASSVSEANMKATQTLASSIQAVDTGRRLKKVQMDFGGRGQGHQTCTVLAERTEISTAQDDAKKSIPSRISNQVYAAPGAYGDPIAAQNAMVQAHKDSFCTSAQEASGMCVSSKKFPGLNLQAATLFTEAAPGSDVEHAQNLLINQMVGLPDAPVPTIVATSAASEDYQLDKMRKDALISPAITSLKAIQSEYNPNGGEARNGKSVMKMYREQVGRYLGGGEEYTKWNKTLTGSEERGVMKEILQVKALDIAMAERQYRQNERMEALLASVVALEDHLQENGLGYQSAAGRNQKTELEQRRTAMRIENSMSLHAAN